MGLIVCPSRELARQTFEVINGYIGALKEDGHPELRSLLVMGGIDMKMQVCVFIVTFCCHFPLTSILFCLGKAGLPALHERGGALVWSTRLWDDENNHTQSPSFA